MVVLKVIHVSIEVQSICGVYTVGGMLKSVSCYFMNSKTKRMQIETYNFSLHLEEYL